VSAEPTPTAAKPTAKPSAAAKPADARYNPALFETGRWDAGLNPKEHKRLAAILAAIPKGAQRIVDVGCGDGRLAHRLAAAGFDVVGVDQSPTALARVQVPRCRCSADALPFADDTFDVAICAEVIEHLPEPLFSNTLKELRRVARDCVIITVPYNEEVDAFPVRCPACATAFNSWGHLHTFDEDRLRRLLPNCAEVRRIHNDRRYYHPVLRHLAFKTLKRSFYAPDCVCPRCGNRDFSSVETDYIRKAIGGLNRLMTRGKRIPGGWILGRFDAR
jgi:SAM-dependent methyltransferase